MTQSKGHNLILRLLMLVVLLACSLSASAALSNEKKEQVRELLRNTHDSIRTQHQIIRSSRRELLNLYLDYDLDAEKAKSLAAKINSGQLALLKQQLKTELELRDILSSDEFSAMKKKMRTHRPGPGPGRGKGGGTPPGDEMGMVFGPENRNAPHIDALERRLPLTTNAERKAMKDLSGKMQGYIQKIVANVRGLMKMYDGYEVKKSDAESIIDDLNENQKLLTSTMLRKQLFLRKFLTEDEFIDYRNSVVAELEKMRKGHGGGKGRGHGK